MDLMKGTCPECGVPMESHSVQEVRITKKTIYVKLMSYGNECEFVGLIIS